jgi:hypothetical protein
MSERRAGGASFICYREHSLSTSSRRTPGPIRRGLSLKDAVGRLLRPSFPSPREATGRDQGWGVAQRTPLSANLPIDPPPPTPQSELRSSRPRHALTRAEGGEKKDRHCEPTGRANARPMTGSAKQSIEQQGSKNGLLRCARNDAEHKSAFPRRISPGFCSARSVLQTEGAGNAGRLVRPQRRVQG